jgi:hypothetical protein
MNSKILEKYAEQKNLDIKILKMWKDSFSNLMVVFKTGGRKYGIIGKDDPNDRDWNFFRGVGASKVTKDMPAGRGDFLVAEKVDAPIVDQVLEAIKTQGVQKEIVDNKNNVSWAPKNEAEKENLAKLVKKWSEVNDYLSQSGFGHTGGDKLIYGEDIIPEDISAFKITPQDFKATPQGSAATSYAKGNTPQVESFIPFLSKSFLNIFGRDLIVGSTFRNSLEQARAMRYPLASGDYDRLYGHLGVTAEQIKSLISEERYEEAAKIIEKTSLAQGSHMAGRAIDIPFSKNVLRTSDYNRFKEVVRAASEDSKIPARMNSEKSTHFHIDVG